MNRKTLVVSVAAVLLGLGISLSACTQKGNQEMMGESMASPMEKGAMQNEGMMQNDSMMKKDTMMEEGAESDMSGAMK